MHIIINKETSMPINVHMISLESEYLILREWPIFTNDRKESDFFSSQQIAN